MLTCGKERGEEREKGTWILTSLNSSSLVILPGERTVSKSLQVQGCWEERGRGAEEVEELEGGAAAELAAAAAAVAQWTGWGRTGE